MACSAVSGEGLLEGIDWVVNDVKSRIFMME
jgi:ADP-ribosylation factor-like protein 2